MQSNHDKNWNRLRSVIQKSLEGSLTPEECQFLNDVMLENADARRYYIDYITIHNGLFTISEEILNESVEQEASALTEALFKLSEYEAIAPEIEIRREEPQQALIQKVIYPPQERHKLSKFSIFTLMMSAAAVLFFVLFLRFAPNKQYAVEVATLVDQLNTTWADAGVSFAKGDRLWTNQEPVVLKKGVVKIQYDDGVDVLIEGPASFTVERSGMYVEYGRLFSRVNESGLGFVVETPTARFVDQGTEFGAQADVNGSAQLHVIKGKVQLFAGPKGSPKSSQLISENQAARYDANTRTIESVPVRTEAFVRQIDSASNSIWRGQKALDLADIVNGGNGLGTGRKGGCIVPNTGEFAADAASVLEDLLDKNLAKKQSYMHPVPDVPGVDCVIVPGQGGGDLPVSTTELSVPDFPKVLGGFRWPIQTQTYALRGYPIILNGTRYDTETNPAILVHASSGITFDLDKIRQGIGGLDVVSFKAVGGINEAAVEASDDPESTADIYVLLDGKQVFHHVFRHIENNAVPIEIDLTGATSSRFLTLLVCSQDGSDYDWGVFGKPELVLESR